MGTRLYLECIDHTPPLRAVEESGQHYRDIAHIFKLIGPLKDKLLHDCDSLGLTPEAEWSYASKKLYSRGWEDVPYPLNPEWEGVKDHYRAYFTWNTALFLLQHRNCNLQLIDSDRGTIVTEEDIC